MFNSSILMKLIFIVRKDFNVRMFEDFSYLFLYAFLSECLNIFYNYRKELIYFQVILKLSKIKKRIEKIDTEL